MNMYVDTTIRICIFLYIENAGSFYHTFHVQCHEVMGIMARSVIRCDNVVIGGEICFIFHVVG